MCEYKTNRRHVQTVLYSGTGWPSPRCSTVIEPGLHHAPSPPTAPRPKTSRMTLSTLPLSTSLSTRVPMRVASAEENDREEEDLYSTPNSFGLTRGSRAALFVSYHSSGEPREPHELVTRLANYVKCTKPPPWKQVCGPVDDVMTTAIGG